MIYSSYIRQEVEKVWPECRNVWLTDRWYHRLSIKKLTAFVDSYDTDFEVKGADCEEYALYMMSDYRREYPQDPFGQCIARKIHGIGMVHTCNIAITNEGIHLVEPQVGAIWKPDPDEDDIFFIKL